MRDVLEALAAANGVDATIQRVVDLARDCLRMDLACVSRLCGDSLVVETTSGDLPGTPIVAGLSFDVCDSYYHLTHDIDADPARIAMATALHTFAASTDATLLAEGVETATELQTIIGLGIGRAQGDHLDAPVDLATTLQRHARRGTDRRDRTVRAARTPSPSSPSRPAQPPR